MTYLYTKTGRFGGEQIFSAGHMVPDLACAMTAETGETWRYIRKEQSCSYAGPFGPWASIERARDGLRVTISTEAWNKTTRGLARIDFKGSGCGDNYPRGETLQTTFAHNRPLKAIARQIISKVIAPQVETLATCRAANARQRDTANDTAHRLAAIAAAYPAATVTNWTDRETQCVSIAGLRVTVTPSGYARVENGSLSMDELADLCEFFQSRAAQMATA